MAALDRISRAHQPSKAINKQIGVLLFANFANTINQQLNFFENYGPTAKRCNKRNKLFRQMRSIFYKQNSQMRYLMPKTMKGELALN